MNDLPPTYPYSHKPKVFKRFMHIIVFGIIFLVIAGVALTSKTLFSAEDSLFAEIKNFSKDYLMYSIKASQGKVKLKGEENDRINILLTGMGGAGHEGGTLTDTIIVASYKPSTQELSMMSLPRDLLVYIPNYAWRKINHLYYFGNLEQPGQGSEFTMDFISQLLEIPIHYHVTVDFDSFIEIIDNMEGIDVMVEETINDYSYPIRGRENAYPISSRYEHLYIEKGLQTMDGNLALKYVRSRHTNSAEGSDYARSRRQQLVLEAIKEKVLSANTILNPSRINSLIKTIKNNVSTNLEFDEIMRAVGWSRQFDTANIITRVIDASPDGPLRENNYNGGFVLETKTGDFSELRFIAQNIFNPDKQFDTSKRKAIEEPLNTEPTEENVTRDEEATVLSGTLPDAGTLPSIDVRNATYISGFASKAAKQLRETGFTINMIGNALDQNQQTTQVYNLTGSELSPKLVDYFKSNFDATQFTNYLPATMREADADIVLVIGLDSFY